MYCTTQLTKKKSDNQKNKDFHLAVSKHKVLPNVCQSNQSNFDKKKLKDKGKSWRSRQPFPPSLGEGFGTLMSEEGLIKA